MNKLLLISAILFLLINSESYGQKQYLLDDKEVVVTGKIINYNRATSPLAILLQQSNLLGSSLKHNENINHDGTFNFKLPANSIQEWCLVYTEYIFLLVRPGDTLLIEIDDNKIDHPEFGFSSDEKQETPKKEKREFYKFSNNEAGQASYLMNKFNEFLSKELASYNLPNGAVQNYAAQEYTEYIKNKESVFRSIYKNFTNHYKVTNLFEKWMEDHLKYNSWDQLMRYRWVYPHYKKISHEDFKIDSSYFNFLSDYDENESELFSFAHMFFLHELSMYTGGQPYRNLHYYFPKFLEENPNISSKKVLEYIENHIGRTVGGFTKELFITKFYDQYLGWQMIDKFEASYDSSYTQEPYFKNAIKTKYQELQSFLEKQNIEKYNLISIESDITSNIIDSITQKFKGKVVYIDFWAPWCGPCMEEIPHMKKIQNHFQSDDVVFLFIANRTKPDSWKATIANKDIKGEHMLITNDQFGVLSKHLGIGGIPHYTLIDQEGNIISKNAARPSEKERVLKDIGLLLQK